MSKHTSEPSRAFGIQLRQRRKRSTFKAAPVIAHTREGFAGVETNDCGVWTLAAVLCVPYGEAHALLERAGRRQRFGVYSEQMILAASFAGYTMREHSRPRVRVKRTDTTNYGGNSVSWFEEKSPTARNVLDYVPARGHFYVSTGHHAFAVVDGVIHDNGGLRPRCRISRVYEIVI